MSAVLTTVFVVLKQEESIADLPVDVCPLYIYVCVRVCICISLAIHFKIINFDLELFEHLKQHGIATYKISESDQILTVCRHDTSDGYR